MIVGLSPFLSNTQYLTCIYTPKSMSLKTDKLAQRIREVQKFVADRGSQDVAYGAIAPALRKLGDSLQEGKLVVQIVSQDQTSAQALLQKLLDIGNFPKEVYQFKTANLPNLPEPDKSQPPSIDFSRRCSQCKWTETDPL